jgi:hypothetical protein
MILYKIKPTLTGLFQEFGLTVVLLLLFIALSIGSYGTDLDWLFMVISAYLFFVTLAASDFLFSKEIVKGDSVKYIRMSLFRFEITNRSYLLIANSPGPNRYGFKHYQLILVRNSRRRMSRLFKNKIRLCQEDGEIDLVGIARKIEHMFEIEYRGVIDVNGSEKT